MLWKRIFGKFFAEGQGRRQPFAGWRSGSANRLRSKLTTSRRSQFQRPGFRDQTFSAPAIVFLFLHQPETGFFVEAPRGGEFALRPEDDLFVASQPREVNTLAHQTLADAQAAGGGFDQQEPQLGDCGGLPAEKD